MKKILFLAALFGVHFYANAQCKFVELSLLQKMVFVTPKERVSILITQGFKFTTTVKDDIGMNQCYGACYITYKDGYAAFEQNIVVQTDAAVTFQTLNKENYLTIFTLLQKTKKYEGRSKQYGEKFIDDTYIYSLMPMIAAYGIEQNHPRYIIAVSKK